MVWLIELLKPIWTWFLSVELPQLIKEAYDAIKHWQEQRAMEKAQKAAAQKALDEYQQSGKTPGLTQEQKAKEQDDAFDKFIDDTNHLP